MQTLAQELHSLFTNRRTAAATAGLLGITIPPLVFVPAGLWSHGHALAQVLGWQAWAVYAIVVGVFWLAVLVLDGVTLFALHLLLAQEPDHHSGRW